MTPDGDEYQVDVVVEPEGGSTPWLDEDSDAATGAPAPVSSDPPSCLSTNTPNCTPTHVCEEWPGSPTGHQWFIYSYGGGQSAGPCEPDNTQQSPSITPGRVLQAFRRIPPPAAELDIQPPGGKTLVNLDTIFSTTTRDLDRTLTLLGKRVQLHITPTTYTWHHGDGTSQTSDWPGRAWEEGVDMSAYLVHAYTDAHVTVAPSVDVTYAAEYRIGNQPWRPVDGTVTIEGPPASLRVLEARPVLTGEGH